jgi:hypothetical protein
MLGHYWTANEPEEARRAQIEDWFEDVAEFGPGIVAEACGAWRRSESRRPTPADIRALCIREQTEHAPVRRVTISGPTDRDAWARSLGWSSFLERQDAIAAEKQRQLNGDWNHPERRTPVATARGFKSAAAALGVTAREYTPEEMAAGRRALGLDGATQNAPRNSGGER